MWKVICILWMLITHRHCCSIMLINCALMLPISWVLRLGIYLVIINILLLCSWGILYMGRTITRSCGLEISLRRSSWPALLCVWRYIMCWSGHLSYTVLLNNLCDRHLSWRCLRRRGGRRWKRWVVEPGLYLGQKTLHSCVGAAQGRTCGVLHKTFLALWFRHHNRRALVHNSSPRLGNIAWIWKGLVDRYRVV